MFAVKCTCRQMAKPTVGAWKKLKRVGRYLVGKSRSILKYDWQGRETLVDGYTDSDWAGCVRTAKSTSGGILMIGGHMIKAWSKDAKQYLSVLSRSRVDCYGQAFNRTHRSDEFSPRLEL